MVVNLYDREENELARFDYGWAWEHPYRDRPLPHTPLRHRVLRVRDRKVCGICNQPGADTVARRVPTFMGGTDDESNLISAHRWRCFLRKQIADVRLFYGTGPERRNPPDTA